MNVKNSKKGLSMENRDKKALADFATSGSLGVFLPKTICQNHKGYEYFWISWGLTMDFLIQKKIKKKLFERYVSKNEQKKIRALEG